MSLKMSTLLTVPPAVERVYTKRGYMSSRTWYIAQTRYFVMLQAGAYVQVTLQYVVVEN